MTYSDVTTHPAWLNLANCIRWEGFLTVRSWNFPDHSVLQKEVVNLVIRPLALHLKLRLATLGVHCAGHAQHGPHAHLLLVSHNGQLSHRIEEAEAFLKGHKSKLNDHKNAIDIQKYRTESESDHGISHITYTANHVADAGYPFIYGYNIIKELKRP